MCHNNVMRRFFKFSKMDHLGIFGSFRVHFWIVSGPFLDRFGSIFDFLEIKFETYHSII